MGDGGLMIGVTIAVIVVVLVLLARWRPVREYFGQHSRVSSPSTPQVKKKDVLSPAERRQVAAEIVTATDAGGSQWVEGVEIAERHGVSVFDVHDEVMAILDARDRQEYGPKNVRLRSGAEPIDFGSSGASARAVGTVHWVDDSTIAVMVTDHFVLVREPRNEHDTNAIAVYGAGRKVGYVSAVRAATYAPLFDAAGASQVRVIRQGTDGVCFKLPSVTVLRRSATSATPKR